MQPASSGTTAPPAALGGSVALTLLGTVPNLIGLSEQAAQYALTHSRLRPGSVETRPSDETPGSVLAQSPQPGSRATPQSRVDLVLAAIAPEAPFVRVPSLNGLTTEEARTLLADNELLLGSLEERASALAPGTVLEQAPAAGSEAAPNSSVDVVIAVPAPAPPTVPPWAWLAGGMFGVGAATLTIARLRARRKRRGGSRKGPKPRVEPHPDGGTQQFEGSLPTVSGPALRLRPIPDRGKASIVPPEPTIQHEENDHEP